MATRFVETNLLQLANAGERSTANGSGTVREGSGGGFQRRNLPTSTTTSAAGDETVTNSTSPGSAPRGGPRGRFRPQSRFLSFLDKEGAALVVAPSFSGEAGTFFVSAANVPNSDTNSFGSSSNTPRAWSTNAPAIPPQITLASEDYNRIARMIEQG